jgi:hypothetical protein
VLLWDRTARPTASSIARLPAHPQLAGDPFLLVESLSSALTRASISNTHPTGNPTANFIIKTNILKPQQTPPRKKPIRFFPERKSERLSD